MDKLSKAQKDEYATAFAILALYDGGADVTSEQITNLLEATKNKEVEAFYPIIFANYLSNPDKIGELIATPGGSGGGGGGAGAAEGGAEEEKEEEKEEEVEEMEMGGGMDMFGAEEGAGGEY